MVPMPDINTVGTVRVNTLFDAVKALEVIVRSLQFVGLPIGVLLICHYILKKSELPIPILGWKFSRRGQLIIGIVLIAIGLSIEKIVDYLFAGI